MSDIVEWLKSYAVATGAIGMTEEADRLMEASEEITRLREQLAQLEGNVNEATSYGLYWQMTALGGR